MGEVGSLAWEGGAWEDWGGGWGRVGAGMAWAMAEVGMGGVGRAGASQAQAARVAAGWEAAALEGRALDTEGKVAGVAGVARALELEGRGTGVARALEREAVGTEVVPAARVGRGAGAVATEGWAAAGAGWAARAARGWAGWAGPGEKCSCTGTGLHNKHQAPGTSPGQ